jgi:hypothetical protein
LSAGGAPGPARILRAALARVLRRSYAATHAAGRTRAALAAWRRRGAEPLLVYQMGKVGSASVLEALRERLPDRDVLHVHFLAPEKLAAEERMYRERFARSGRIDGHHFVALRLRARLEASRGRRWQIVTLVRDPVARNLSAFFQTLEHAAPELSERIARGENAGIADALRRQLEATPWWWRDPLEWFDEELRAVFGVDAFAEPFPRERGWQILRAPRADVLLLRMEDLSRVAGEAFGAFLGVTDLALARRNAGDDKPYAAAYRLLSEGTSLDEELLEAIYGGWRIRHFYTDVEIARMRARWSGRRPS